jgi:hypothetical protein
MKHLKSLFVVLLGLAMTGAMVPVAVAQGGGAQVEVQWQEPGPPPGNWSQAWHSGFHDGAIAAHHDISANRPPDPRRHDTFRHPDVPHNQRRDFREGFRRGYQMVYHHDWRH